MKLATTKMIDVYKAVNPYPPITFWNLSQKTKRASPSASVILAWPLRYNPQ